MNTDNSKSITPADMLKHSSITDLIIGSFYEVYNELGQGFLESVYREALAHVLTERGLRVEKEKPVTVRFRGVAVGIFRTDLLVNNAVVVELKCARTIDPVHEAQLLNYLNATNFEVGLLLNFGIRPQFRRMLLDNVRKQVWCAQSSDHGGECSNAKRSKT
jgi:GxxExxY protein